ncbi:unnamed protein product [Fructobacillus evanidus]|uniref:Uncharacterized protein n=1 Tax=Fructobacillus evanidus TaxID=3064281 RepID=A0ABN9YX57_9LACO|nr:unnamed protein product [Fructobacillus sp. LMG 32999]CAK1251517.1 unnamed protein product [Fructobacillus sp. LMG 32999]
MAVLINVKEELGISKPIKVKESNANMRKTLQFQKEMARLQVEQEKLQGRADKSKSDAQAAQLMSNMFDMMMKMLDNVQVYIVEILHLDEEKQDYIEEEMDFNETMDLANKISGKIMKVEPTDATEEGDDLKA